MALIQEGGEKYILSVLAEEAESEPNHIVCLEVIAVRHASGKPPEKLQYDLQAVVERRSDIFKRVEGPFGQSYRRLWTFETGTRGAEQFYEVDLKKLEKLLGR